MYTTVSESLRGVGRGCIDQGEWYLLLNFFGFQVTHWHSPQFHAYFPTGNSYPAIVADILSDAIGCIGFSWVGQVIQRTENISINNVLIVSDMIL